MKCDNRLWLKSLILLLGAFKKYIMVLTYPQHTDKTSSLNSTFLLFKVVGFMLKTGFNDHDLEKIFTKSGFVVNSGDKKGNL